MKQLAIMNVEHCTEQEIAALPLRRTARAVLFDDQGRIGLLHVTRDGYHKLPGGGIDPGETILEGLHRECLEETGCRIEVLAELGWVMEYRRSSNMAQESYVYLACVVGQKGTLTLTQVEQAAGFQLVWVTLADAIMETDKQAIIDAETGLCLLRRDGLLLREARTYLEQHPEALMSMAIRGGIDSSP